MVHLAGDSPVVEDVSVDQEGVVLAELVELHAEIGFVIPDVVLLHFLVGVLLVLPDGEGPHAVGEPPLLPKFLVRQIRVVVSHLNANQM